MTKATKGMVRQASESDRDLSQEISLQVTAITPEIINYIRRRIIEAIDPQQIVLFGSQALGKTSQGSDLDLLVVHDTGQTNRQVRRLLERLFLHRRFGLDLIVRTPKEVQLNLADGNPFYTDHIFGQGIILYERGENEYIIAGRYPGDVAYETIGKGEAEEAVNIVRRIKALVKTGESSE